MSIQIINRICKKLLPSIISILCLVFGSQTCLASAPSGLTISGHITDAETGEPLEFVLVTLPDQNLWAETDIKGAFSIAGLRPGSYTIEVKSTGYKPYSETVKLSSKTQPLKIKLQQLSLALNEVVVTSNVQKLG